jgi:hypothetical protein
VLTNGNIQAQACQASFGSILISLDLRHSDRRLKAVGDGGDNLFGGDRN